MTHGSLCGAHACVCACRRARRQHGALPTWRKRDPWLRWRYHCHCKQVSGPPVHSGCCQCLVLSLVATCACYVRRAPMPPLHARRRPWLACASCAPRVSQAPTSLQEYMILASVSVFTTDPSQRVLGASTAQWRVGWRGCAGVAGSPALADSPACAHDAKPRSTHVPRWSLADETPRHSLQAFVEGATLAVFGVDRRTCMLRAAWAGVALASVAGAPCAALVCPNKAGCR